MARQNEMEQLRKLDESALRNRLLELRREQFHLRAKRAFHDLARPHEISAKKRSVARVQTLLSSMKAQKRAEVANGDN